jgi:predicted acyl esterase
VGRSEVVAKPPSVREQIAKIQRVVRDSVTLPPAQASDLLNNLTGLLGNVLAEVREREVTYRSHYADCRRKFEKANAAKIEAESSPQYAAWREAVDAKVLTEQLIVSLRASVRLHTEEMRLTR